MRTADSAIPFLPTMQYNASHLLLLVFLRSLFVSFSLKEKAKKYNGTVNGVGEEFSVPTLLFIPKQNVRPQAASTL